MKINLICNAGMSTSILVGKIRKVVEDRGLDIEINAYSSDSVDSIIDETDILLIGPQMRYIERKLRERYPDQKMAVINSQKYGMMDAKGVLDDALAL